MRWGERAVVQISFFLRFRSFCYLHSLESLENIKVEEVVHPIKLGFG